MNRFCTGLLLGGLLVARVAAAQETAPLLVDPHWDPPANQNTDSDDPKQPSSPAPGGEASKVNDDDTGVTSGSNPESVKDMSGLPEMNGLAPEAGLPESPGLPEVRPSPTEP
jgi:hypothetical protein